MLRNRIKPLTFPSAPFPSSGAGLLPPAGVRLPAPAGGRQAFPLAAPLAPGAQGQALQKGNRGIHDARIQVQLQPREAVFY